MILHAWTDGSSSNNPKDKYVSTGGWAYILLNKEQTEVVDLDSGRAYPTTNNVMEAVAALYAIERSIQLGAEILFIHTDSQYVIQGFQKAYEFNLRDSAIYSYAKNKDTWHTIIRTLRENGLSVRLKKVKGHAGVKYNEMADKLAGEARKTLKHEIDKNNNGNGKHD